MNTGSKLQSLSEQIDGLEEEMEVILMERIRDKANAERYDRMIRKRETEISALRKQIEELENIEATLKQHQATLRRDIRLMDSILAEGRISEANLRLLVEKIYISERDGKLDVDIHLKAPFQTHGMFYEDGEVTDAWSSLDYDWDRLGAILMEDLCENESMAVLSAVQG